MPPVSLFPGDSRTILPLASRAPTTPFKVSETYVLLESGGMVIDVTITDVSGGGSIDAIRVLDNDTGVFDVAVPFDQPPLPLNAAGRYKFIIAPGAVDAASYSGYRATLPPVQGLIEVLHHDANAIVYSVRIQCVKH